MFKAIKSLLLVALCLLSLSVLAQETEKFTCPMHPHYIAEEMGTCPYCGMDLVPLQTQANEPETAENGSNLDSEDEKMATRSAIRINSEIIQKMGVRIQAAEQASFGQFIRSYGSVTENARLTQTLTSRVAGWIETLNITAIGDTVRAGDELFGLYSPQLISAQQDYIAALSTGQSTRINAAEARLQALGLHASTIATLKSQRRLMQQVPFMASSAGIVSDLNVSLGDYVEAGKLIARLQDYQSVWVNVSVAEQDLEFINPNSSATVIFPNLGNQRFEAKIDYVEPTITRNSRTGQVRLLLDNPDGILRPGAYADVLFEVNPVERLSVPSESILKSMRGDYVIQALGEGRFRPQFVETGIHNRGRTEIVSGLNQGDKIVISGQFLIDSESALLASFHNMQQSQRALSEIEVNPQQMAMLNHYIDAALYVHETLYKDTKMDPDFLNPASELSQHLLPIFGNTNLGYVINDAHKAVEQAQKSRTDSERKAALASLAEALLPWLQEGKPQYYQDKNIRLFIEHGENRHWLQLGDEMQNPYGDAHAVPVSLLTETPEPDSEPMETAIIGGSHASH